MNLINPKDLGIDPVKIADIQTQVDATVKDVRWIVAAAKYILQQLATRFHFDLPPDPQ